MNDNRVELWPFLDGVQQLFVWISKPWDQLTIRSRPHSWVGRQPPGELNECFLVLWFDLCCSCVTGPPGSTASCACVAGYQGNGTHCEGQTDTSGVWGYTTWKHSLKRLHYVLCLSEVDMCSQANGGCSEFATCTKLSAGERSCTCKEGYTGDGTVCLGGSSDLDVL